ncbi:SDR family oxidoreductase [Solirubrobacter sp. CPCC 204708]|uniref:SDR family oxidoreductase n=1 Tax=Solirubrobacter deserti TaxID=2282478 RepID=A0ABT4RD85_9ACTN|nr:SDR family oxidoreductase [Solirubrobacter deserti]MBE2317752.1 SDR family oxidoreductase [Solirubrobacter deserti]MDA0136471.1 SDR family oxidoreductase [Solirubrobacter deserti]
MKIVIIGGTGQIGSKVVARLSEQGHEAVAASPRTGVNTLTGEGLREVLVGADVVVDVTNAPDWEDQASLDFFTTSTRNQLAAEVELGVKHHVALSVVGSREMPGSGYMRAKVAQEDLIVASGVRYSILHATQFFEFVPWIADASKGEDGKVHVSPAHFQPIAADDVADFVTRVAVGEPVGAVEIAGPDRLGLDEAVRMAVPDADVVSDPAVGYFGADVDDTTLTAGENAWLGEQRFADWVGVALRG